jgi:hypothetical protein
MSTLTTYDELIQGSDEWLEARRGIITASAIGQLITPTLKVANNDTSRGLIATLAAERLTGHVEDVWVSADMQRGNDEEPIARDLYANHHNVAVTEVGFMVREHEGVRVGYSPDGLVEDIGLIEVKSRKPKKHLQTILADRVPAENMAQIQCGLWVTGRPWCDYISYCGGMRPWVKRVYMDADWFDAIEAAAAAFEVGVAVTIAAYEAATAGLPMTERTPDYNDVELKLA